MPPFRVHPTDNSQPVLRPSSWYEKLYDALSTVSGALPGFPPAEIARQLAPNDVMPMTTVLPAGAVGEAVAEKMGTYRPIKAYHGSTHDFGHSVDQ